MNIIDLHCDALFKLSEAKGKLSFAHSPQLNTNIEKLKIGEVKVQCFAIFIEPDVPSDQQFQAVLGQIHYFYEEVLGKNPEMKQIKKW